MTRKTKAMNDIPANLLYSPDDFEKWLDETRAPLSDDEMQAMSAYFQHEESLENTMEK